MKTKSMIGKFKKLDYVKQNGNDQIMLVNYDYVFFMSVFVGVSWVDKFGKSHTAEISESHLEKV